MKPKETSSDVASRPLYTTPWPNMPASALATTGTAETVLRSTRSLPDSIAARKSSGSVLSTISSSEPRPTLLDRSERRVPSALTRVRSGLESIAHTQAPIAESLSMSRGAGAPQAREDAGSPLR